MNQIKPQIRSAGDLEWETEVAGFEVINYNCKMGGDIHRFCIYTLEPIHRWVPTQSNLLVDWYLHT